MNWKTLKRHPFNVVPNADDKEIAELRQSIEDNGYDAKYPIWIFQGPDDSEPMVIDGMQRLAICSEIDEHPLVREFNGSNSDAIQFILKSIKRRNLNAGQRAAVFQELNVEMIKAQEVEARMRMESGMSDPSPLMGQGGKTADVFSKEAGVGRGTFEQVKSIKSYSPELYEKVKSGNISSQAAYRQVQTKKATKDQRIKIDAKSIIQRRLNEAVRTYAPEFLKIVVSDLLEKGETNIKFKIIIDND